MTFERLTQGLLHFSIQNEIALILRVYCCYKDEEWQGTDHCNTAECNKYGLVQRLAEATHRHTALKESKCFQTERVTTCRSLPVSERTREGAV